MQTIWDPLRKKDVALTPEERVRQWCIQVLARQYKVPMHMMMSEASLKLGGKSYRADIIAYDRSLQPALVVECKRPEVEITAEVLDQAICYNMVLDVKFILITNGMRTYILKKDNERFVQVQTLPEYDF
jgi:type I site-specific restriction endonuclease